MKINVSPAAEEAMIAAAAEIEAYIRGNLETLVCLAAGKTPLPIFSRLIEAQNVDIVSPFLSAVYYVGLDEWVGVGRETEGSCAQVMYDNFYTPAGVPPERVCAWDGLCPDADAEKARIESYIEHRGGIGLAVLGIGMNGHVGFNEPHIDPAKKTALVRLEEITKTVSSKYFLKEMPVAYGLTVGLAELYNARRIILVATGAHKADILSKAVAGGPDPAVPASLLTGHPDIALYADSAAASLIK